MPFLWYYLSNMKKIILALSFILLTQSTSFAIEDVKKVFLQEAIDAAVENNIDLEAAKLNIQIAKNNIKSANRLQNPQLDYFQFFGAAGWSEPRQVGINQPFEIAKRGARKKLAKSNLKLTEKNVDYTKFDLKMDVREAYVNLVAAKSVHETLYQQQKLQEELLGIVKGRVKVGKVPEIDLIQAEIALNQMITQVNTAKVNVKTALSNFNKIINNPNKITYDSKDKIFDEENNFIEMLTPNPTLKFPDISEIIDEALKNRYDLQIAKQEIDVAEKNLKLIARQRVPDLAILGGFAFQGAQHTIDNRFNGGAYVGASVVNIPLLYNYGPEIKNAALKLQQAELNYISVRNKAEKDVEAAYEKFLTAAENLNDYESKILTSSDELIDISIKAYETGKSDLTALIVMKQSYKSILVGHTYALADYYNSWTNFLREVNDENFKLHTSL